MEKVNSELVLQNSCIMEQNERLKKAAELLQQERQRLLSQLNARTVSASDHHQGGKDNQKHKHKRPAGAGSSSSPGAGAGAGAGVSTQASSEAE